MSQKPPGGAQAGAVGVAEGVEVGSVDEGEVEDGLVDGVGVVLGSVKDEVVWLVGKPICTPRDWRVCCISNLPAAPSKSKPS